MQGDVRRQIRIVGIVWWWLFGGWLEVLGFCVVSSRCVRSRQGAFDSCGSCALPCRRMRRASFVCFLAGLLRVYEGGVFRVCGWSVRSCRPCGLQSYLASAFFCGSALISVFHFGLFCVVCGCL